MIGLMMAGFLEKILSGRYPNLEGLWGAEFRRVVDEAFATPDPDVFEDEYDCSDCERKCEVASELLEESNDYIDSQAEVITALKGEVSRLEALLGEEQCRHKAVKRELEVVRGERTALVYRLDAVKHAINAGGRHAEPIG